MDAIIPGPADEPTSLDFQLSPGSSITLHITDPAGNPVTGLDVTQGADPDSARISNLAASDSRVVTVSYTVGMAPVGTIDTLIFLARPVSSPSQTDEVCARHDPTSCASPGA